MDHSELIESGFYNSENKVAPAKIEYRIEKDEVRSAAENRDCKKEIEYITIYIDQSTTRECPFDALTEEEQRNYARLHQRFLETRLPTTVDGTPLSDLTWMTRSRAEEYVAIKVFTVEHLANAKEETIKKAGMGAREEVAKAKAFLKAAKDGKHLSKLAEENEKLKSQVEILQDELKALSAAFKDMKASKIS